jgi:hypothetical protein
MVAPISGDPSPYGLLGGCTDVVTATDPHELNGTDTLSLSCADSNLWQDCPAPEFPNPATKVFDRPRTCTYEPITVYAGVTCSTFGLSYEEGQQRALEQLRLGEQRALEEFFMTRVLCGYATGNDLTPAAGALSVPAGIGALEGWLATNYGGQGVLHVPAGAAALLGHHRVLDFDGRRALRTLAGNCVTRRTSDRPIRAPAARSRRPAKRGCTSPRRSASAGTQPASPPATKAARSTPARTTGTRWRKPPSYPKRPAASRLPSASPSARKDCIRDVPDSGGTRRRAAPGLRPMVSRPGPADHDGQRDRQ